MYLLTKAARNAAKVACYLELKRELAKHPMATSFVTDDIMREVAQATSAAACDAIDETEGNVVAEEVALAGGGDIVR